MDGNLASTYTLIHSFLLKHSHLQVARALKKAAKDVVILKDDIDPEGPSLDVILKEWKGYHDKEMAQSSGSESESSDSSSDSSESSDSSSDSSESSDSSSDSESSDSSSDSSDSSDSSSSESESDPSDSASNAGASPKKKALPSKLKKKDHSGTAPSSASRGSQSDGESDDTGVAAAAKNKKKFIKKHDMKIKTNQKSSATLTSGSGSSSDSTEKQSEHEKTVKKAVRKGTGKGGTTKPDPSAGSSSSDDTSSSDSTEKQSEHKKTVKKAVRKKTGKGGAAKPDSSSGSSSSDDTSRLSSDADMQFENPATSSNKAATKPPKESTEVEPTAIANPLKRKAADSNDVQLIKKRRTSEKASETVTATGQTVESSTNPQPGHKAKPGRVAKTPFQRVQPDKVPKHFIQDNDYTAKAGPTNDYGQRAHQDLIVTRGAGFRKEKNKKKRGSYKGGEITLESHSFKFE